MYRNRNSKSCYGEQKYSLHQFSGSDFYIPCTPQKRFQNTEYYFRSNPTVTASIIHCEQIFLYFFLIHWCNDLIMKSRREEECSLILKQMLIKNTSSLQVCNWSTEKMPDWFEQYLIDSGLEKRNDIYSPAKSLLRYYASLMTARI